MIKLLVADDHAIIREGLKQILAGTHDICITDEANNIEEALNRSLKNNYDVVVLDITMPDGSGLDLLNELKRRKPEIKVLILSMHPEKQYAIRALQAGASGYLTKDNLPGEFIVAIKRVACGHKYVSASLAEKLAIELDGRVGQPHRQTLSDREFQVMHMIASGKKLTEIAGELDLNVKTVGTYRTRILRKMRVENNAELIRYCLENKLLD